MSSFRGSPGSRTGPFLPGILVFGPGAPRGCHQAPRCRVDFGGFWGTKSSCLVVDLPLWKIWKSVGIIIPNIWKKWKNNPNVHYYSYSQYMEKYGKIIQIFQTTNQPGFEANKNQWFVWKKKTSDLSQNQKIWSFNQQKSGICCSDLSECQVSSSPKEIYQHKLFLFFQSVCVCDFIICCLGTRKAI